MSAALQQTPAIAGQVPANTSIVPLKAGGMVQAFVPTTYDEAWRMSQGIVQGGFNPPSLKSPQAVMQAIVYGLEVGMKPFMALRNIAIINNRPCVWGDALPGLVYASGLCEFIEVTYEGEGEALTAICTAQRKGSPRPVTDRFSVADAKKAGVWGKQGPWSQYPRRMLGIRARSFLLRDTFPDVLGGINVAEEVMDLPPEDYQDITPPPAPPAEEESSAAAAPAIQRKPRATRKASAAPPAAEPEGQESDAADAAVASDAPPAPIEDATYSEVAQDGGPPPVGNDFDPENEDPEELFAEYEKHLLAGKSLEDIGATWDIFEGRIKGQGPDFMQRCSARYVKRKEELQGETKEQRAARLRPAYDDGIASFFRGRKRSLGAPAAYKDGGEFEKAWWKGYENADQGREPNPDAPPPADDSFPGDKPPPADKPLSQAPAVSNEAAIDAAYELGRQAKQKGMSSRAVPGEFRAEGREDEALAWRQGYNDAAKA